MFCSVMLKCTDCWLIRSSIFWVLMLMWGEGNKNLRLSMNFAGKCFRSNLFLLMISSKYGLETLKLSHRSRWTCATSRKPVKSLITACLCCWVNLFCSNIVSVTGVSGFDKHGSHYNRPKWVQILYLKSLEVMYVWITGLASLSENTTKFVEVKDKVLILDFTFLITVKFSLHLFYSEFSFIVCEFNRKRIK